MRETLENGNYYLDKKHGWLIITTDGRWIINLCSRDYGYHQFTFSKEEMNKYGGMDAKKSVLEWKYDELIKWISKL